MASILIRCTGGTDIPADALADWLEPQLSRIDNKIRVTALRLEHVDDFSGHPAGWLVELDLADGDLAHAEDFLAEILSDMRLLGLRPAVFHRVGRRDGPHAARRRAFLCHSFPLRYRMSRRDVHRNRGSDPFPSNVSRKNGRAPVVRFLDAIDRARLTPMDVLLLLQIAEAEATVVDLADRLDRRAADVRRATGNLVARGLVRPRADRTLPWGVVFTVTASGLDVLAGLDVPSSFADPRDGNGRRPPRRDPHRRLTADRGASGKA